MRTPTRRSIILTITVPRRGIALLSALAGFVANAAAHDNRPRAAYTESAQHAASPLPDRVVLTFSGDPSESINVTWRTDVETQGSEVEFAVAKGLVGDLRVPPVPGMKSIKGESDVFASDLGDYRLHTALLSGLTPSTVYAYRVGGGDYWSEWFQFRTASDDAEPFSFVYFGDAQNDVRSWWSRVIREASREAPRAAFMLHAGDLVNHANRDAEWGEWFGAGGWLNGMTPTVATPGNHEYRQGLSRHWRPQFAFPLNGPAGLEETAYWFDYQAARFISLNSNEGIEQQTDWLRDLLADTARPKWTICTFHHPIYSAAKNRDNPGVRNAWRDVIEEGGVDLVLTGHDHAYARSGLGGPADRESTNVSEGVRRMSGGAVYVVSVSGPKMYASNETWDVPRVGSGIQLYQIIRVGRERIRYEARTPAGELYDAFVLTKSDDGEKSLVETPPDVPEIRAR